LSDTTYEEARRCPRCENPGLEVSSVRRREGGKLTTFECRNPPCRWYNTPYVVQINADGSIPEATMDHIMTFPKVPDRTDAVQLQMQRLYDQTLTGGETRL